MSARAGGGGQAASKPRPAMPCPSRKPNSVSSSTDPLIHVAEVLEAWEATDITDGSEAMVVAVVLADGSGANLAMWRLVAARLWGALDGRDPSRLDPPPNWRN